MNFLKTCESVFNEIQQMRRDVLAGKISPESFALQMGAISLQERHLKLVIMDTALQYKTKKPIPINFKSLGDPEDEIILCPEQDTEITLTDCLDYSGGHNKECQSCPNFKRSRRLLLSQS